MKMEYKISGKGRPLVLVPGGLTGWISWEPHSKILSENRMVIRVQLLSVQYGNEDRQLPDNYSIKTEGSALGETLDSLELFSRLDIVGWSFGAFTSLMYALDNPGRIRSLTLIEPPAMWVLRSGGKFDVETQKAADFFTSLKGNITEGMLAEFLVHAGFIKPGESARSLPQWNKWTGFMQSLRNSPAVANYTDDILRLREFQVPVLLVKGTGSSVWLHSVIDVLAKNIPYSRVIELPEGHGPHLVSMKEFLFELEKFHSSEEIMDSSAE